MVQEVLICHFLQLDSPNTTSATTYTVFMRTNSGTYIWGADSGTQTFIAQEIGG